MNKMNEYNKLLVLDVAIRDLEDVLIPFNIIKHSIIPLREYLEHRIKELEEQKWEDISA